MDGEQFGKIVWFSVERGLGEISTGSVSFYFTYHSLTSNQKFKTIKPNCYVKFMLGSYQIFGRPAAVDIQVANAQLHLKLKHNEADSNPLLNFLLDFDGNMK